jgi:hypothetical protein
LILGCRRLLLLTSCCRDDVPLAAASRRAQVALVCLIPLQLYLVAMIPRLLCDHREGLSNNYAPEISRPPKLLPEHTHPIRNQLNRMCISFTVASVTDLRWRLRR